MFPSDPVSVEVETTPPVTTAGIAQMIRSLRDGGCDGGSDSGGSDAERITQLQLLEKLKSMRDKARRDIGAQIGLARRVSPRVGARLVGLTAVLTPEMPHLLGALQHGLVDGYQVTLVAGETAGLSRAHRQVVDAELAARFGTMTPAQARGAAARIGYRLDPEQAVRRTRKAHGDRCVTLRPAPDTMTYLSALLPVADGVAAYAALTRHAASASAVGDPRGKGALMADELVARLVRSSRSAAWPSAELGCRTTRTNRTRLLPQGPMSNRRAL